MDSNTYGKIQEKEILIKPEEKKQKNKTKEEIKNKVILIINK